ncbi:MAG: metallophosphoesterase family protein [Anaerolineae bacterium]
MRLAMFSDIHGNSIALEAVLQDCGEVDGFWALGDLVAIGHDPLGVLNRLDTLPNLVCTRGNTDRNVVDGSRPFPSMEQALHDNNLIPKLVEVTGNYAWTQGAITAAGWFDWLADLPLEHRVTLPDGTRVLGVHAAPGTDGGEGIKPTMSDAELAALVEGCEADLVIVGHTHWPLERRINGVHVVNMGAVSLPSQPDLRASYIILHADAHGYEVEFRRAAYDLQAVINAVHAARHPAAEYINSFMEGKWYRKWQKDAPETT